MENNKSIVEILAEVQSKLKAPKSQYNSFGKYNYRNCEDILEALKPIIATYNAAVTISDEIVAVGNRVYVKATAHFTTKTASVYTSAFAREPQEQKGMNEAQITGSASSYARKYALNGLFLIDDTKDADSTNDHGKAPSQVPQTKYTPEVDALKEAAAKAKEKYNKDNPEGVKWEDVSAKTEAKPVEIVMNTISGIVKKYYPLNGKKPHVVVIGGQYYSTYHEGIGKQMSELVDELAHITYRDEPYEYNGETRINHVVEEIKKP